MTCDRCSKEIQESSVDWGCCELCGDNLCNECADGWHDNICSGCAEKEDER